MNTIYDDLPEDIQQAYDSTNKGRTALGNFVIPLIKQLAAKGFNFEPLLQDMSNDQKVEDFLRLKKVISNSNRAVGRDKEYKEITGVDHDEHLEMNKSIGSLITQMNRIMGARKTSRNRLGVASKFNVDTEKETVDPNVQTAIDISNVLGQISTLRSKMRDSGELDDNSEQSLFAAKDPSNNLKQTLKGVSDKAFEASVGLLINLIEQKIDAGSGQTMEGFVKLVNNIKQHPSTPPALGKLFDYILSQLQSSKVEDLYQSVEDVNKFEGYDEDVVKQVLQTPEQQQMFSDWLATHKRWREELDRRLNERYEDKLSAAMAQLKGTYVSPEEEKAKMAEFWAKRNKAEPKTQEFKIPERDTPPVKQESVLSYMEEQAAKDSKFGKPLGEFVDRGFKRVDKYSYWSA
jgi:DNA-binding XRE family transcriptional regulator